MKRERREEKLAVPPTHRAAPVDRVLPVDEDERPRPPLPEKLSWERFDGEGGGSAPMHDAPESGGDLRERKRRA